MVRLTITTSASGKPVSSSSGVQTRANPNPVIPPSTLARKTTTPPATSSNTSTAGQPAKRRFAPRFREPASSSTATKASGLGRSRRPRRRGVPSARIAGPVDDDESTTRRSAGAGGCGGRGGAQPPGGAVDPPPDRGEPGDGAPPRADRSANSALADVLRERAAHRRRTAGRLPRRPLGAGRAGVPATDPTRPGGPCCRRRRAWRLACTAIPAPRIEESHGPRPRAARRLAPTPAARPRGGRIGRHRPDAGHDPPRGRLGHAPSDPSGSGWARRTVAPDTASGQPPPRRLRDGDLRRRRDTRCSSSPRDGRGGAALTPEPGRLRLRPALHPAPRGEPDADDEAVVVSPAAARRRSSSNLPGPLSDDTTPGHNAFVALRWSARGLRHDPAIREEIAGPRRGADVSASDRLTLRNVYLYLVCLITLVVSIFAAVSLVRSAVALIYPDPAAYGYYGYFPAEPGAEGHADRRGGAGAAGAARRGRRPAPGAPGRRRLGAPPCSSPARCTSTTGARCSRSCRRAPARPSRAVPRLPDATGRAAPARGD